jgi:DNA-binding transcriptional regulator YdaS (Cro superfamily)
LAAAAAEMAAVNTRKTAVNQWRENRRQPMAGGRQKQVSTIGVPCVGIMMEAGINQWRERREQLSANGRGDSG